MEPKNRSLSNHSKCQMSCEFIGNSSVHSLSRLSQAKSCYSQVFWLIVFVVTLSGCVYQVYSFLQLYFQYPVLVDLKYQRVKTFDFPAVTVCNLNRMTLNHVLCVNESLTWDQCYSYRSQTANQGPPQGQGGGRPTVLLTEAKRLTSTSKPTSESESTLIKNLMSRYIKLDAVSKKCYGHRLDDFILKCSFNSMTCNITDFAYLHSKQYGNCFTFNRNVPNDLNTKPRLVKRAGPQSGLELVLDAELLSYSNITPAFGVRVVVHSPQEDPHPSENGVSIPFGTETHLSLSKTSFLRLPSPYRDACKNYPLSGELDCIDDCMQRVSMELCGCVDPFLEAARSKTVFCDLLNETQTLCMDKVLDMMSSKILTCDCPLPCLSMEYDVQLQSTVMNWSLVMRSVNSDRNFGRSFEPEFCRGQRGTLPPTKLKVFFKSLDHQIYVQKPMYSDSEFYSQLGGHLSLWLGLSFVALYEFAEKLFLFLKSRVFSHDESAIANSGRNI